MDDLELAQRLAANDNGVRLRLVAMDRWGNLWPFWTGCLPDGSLSRPFRTPGIRSGQAFGVKQFTANYAKAQYGGPSPVINQRLGSMARLLMVKVGDRIDLDIPAASGYARFRNVPVLRVNDIGDFGDLIGLSKARIAGAQEPALMPAK